MSLVMGTVIGSGIFMKPGKVIEYAGGSSLALLAWVLGGILSIAGGLTIAEVSVRIPKTGGLYVYLEEVYGRFWGFLCGWMQTIIYGPAIIGALGLYFGLLLGDLFSLPTSWNLGLGIVTVLFLTIMNGLGTKYGGSIQVITTVCKFVHILLIIIFGLWKGNEQVLSVGSGVTAHLGMGAAMLATLFAYDGWMLVGFVAGEMKNPSKHLPIAIIGGLSIVTITYVIINIAMLHVMPAPEIVTLGTKAAGTAATRLLGNMGGKLVTVGILISIFGCLNGKILAFPRIAYAMALRKQLPFSNLLAKVSAKSGVPFAAMWFEVVLALIVMLFSNPDYLSDMAIFAVYLFYILSFIAVFVMRKREPNFSTYKVPLYPVIPLIAIVGSLFIVLTTLVNEFGDSMLAIGITLIGLPVYYYIHYKKSKLGE
ncbi:MAG: amino acid permease [Gorillibacterium sp.]|nr:amino acid permease [Gorillibacterium sp.]